MKIKFARTLAIASALSVAFAGLTAFAAVPTVETITTYDYTSENVTVTTKIQGLAANTEVAYYVCQEADNSKIVYIDQGTFPATAADGDSDPTLRFTFSDTKADFLSAIAKFGSNSTAADAKFPTFYFNEGTNVLTEDTGSNTALKSNWGISVEVEPTGTETNAQTISNVFKGVVSGNVKEYGVIYTPDGSTNYRFPALGCADDGTYVVVLEGVTDTSKVRPYVIHDDGEYESFSVTDDVTQTN